MRTYTTAFTPLLLALFAVSICKAQKKTIDQKVDSVLQLMTLEEKVGQLNQYSGSWKHTGPITEDNNKLSDIKAQIFSRTQLEQRLYMLMITIPNFFYLGGKMFLECSRIGKRWSK